MKADLRQASTSPREIITNCANEISALFEVFRNNYGFARCNLLLSHILMASTIIHLFNSGMSSAPAATSANLAQGLRDLEALSECHWFAARGFKIVVLLGQRKGIPLPEDVLQDSKLLVPKQPFSPAVPAQNVQGTAVTTSSVPYNYVAAAPSNIRVLPSTSNHEYQPQYSAFDGKQNTSTQHSSASTSIQADSPRAEHMYTAQQLSYSSQYHSLPTEAEDSHAVTATSSIGTNVRQSTLSPTTTGHQCPPEQLLWSPFGDQGMPILGDDINSSPMDLSSMLISMGTEWDGFSKDGFRLSDFAHQEPLLSNGGHPYAVPATQATSDISNTSRVENDQDRFGEGQWWHFETNG
jgi:hypothetical protein